MDVNTALNRLIKEADALAEAIFNSEGMPISTIAYMNARKNYDRALKDFKEKT